MPRLGVNFAGETSERCRCEESQDQGTETGVDSLT